MLLCCSPRSALAGTFEALGCRCPIGAGGAANASPQVVHIKTEAATDAIARSRLRIGPSLQAELEGHRAREERAKDRHDYGKLDFLEPQPPGLPSQE